ncbi:MAG: Ig-like domain-containing protein [Fimbriimonadaceae bacterium]|jgi:tetratricopeptide (TPR) repeat protein|nr:Ig-like domain-containing protein [Fimbriimonadaceae bacterium]
MLTRFSTSLLALIAFAAISPAAVVVTSNTKSGDTIRGEHTFRLTAQPQDVVTKMEMFVGSRLIGTATSTPYTFTLDTLNEADGPFEVRFLAITSEGDNVNTVLKLTIDNGLAKGVDFHVDAANQAVSDGKWDEAIQSGRTALKIDSTNKKGMIALSRAYYGKGVFDLAEKFAGDVLAADAANVEALEMLAAINLRKAFRAFTSGTGDVVSTIGDAMKSAARARRTSTEVRIESFPAVTDSNALAYADLLFVGHRYTRALQVLEPILRRDPTNVAIINRIGFAQARLFRWRDLGNTLRDAERREALDGYGFALKAIHAHATGQRQASIDAEKEALLQGPTLRGVRYAQAYLLLVRGNTQDLARVANNLIQTEAATPHANYYRSVVSFIGGNPDGARTFFENGVLAEPLAYDLYIEAGNQVMARALREGLTGDAMRRSANLALTYYNAALEARPESAEGFTGAALAYLASGRQADAVRMGDAAVRANSNFGPGYLVHAAALRASNRVREATEVIAAGAKIDNQLANRTDRDPALLFNFFYLRGRTPFIPAP